jgi:hypothetical protein
MKLAIMQPYVFPYIGYFQLINAVDKFVILDDVNFITRGWINRNRIIVNGKEHLFSIPVNKSSQNKLISDSEFLDTSWKKKFLKTIEQSYSKAPFYEECFGVISSILSINEKCISKWLYAQINLICIYLKIKTEITESSRVYCNRHLKAQERIIDICIQERTDIYINPIGGRELYNSDAFTKNNIRLYFLKSISEKYTQFTKEFVPSLSIIDVMMFNSVDEIHALLNKYEML